MKSGRNKLKWDYINIWNIWKNHINVYSLSHVLPVKSVSLKLTFPPYSSFPLSFPLQSLNFLWKQHNVFNTKVPSEAKDMRSQKQRLKGYEFKRDLEVKREILANTYTSAAQEMVDSSSAEMRYADTAYQWQRVFSEAEGVLINRVSVDSWKELQCLKSERFRCHHELTMWPWVNVSQSLHLPICRIWMITPALKA